VRSQEAARDRFTVALRRRRQRIAVVEDAFERALQPRYRSSGQVGRNRRSALSSAVVTCIFRGRIRLLFADIEVPELSLNQLFAGVSVATVLALSGRV